MENEAHVVTQCPLYGDIREELFQHALRENEQFHVFSDDEKLCFILSNPILISFTGRALRDILYRQRLLLFT